MAGALMPMALAWRLQRRMRRPAAAPAFDLPATRRLDARLFAGAALFGIGWGAAGLCPGPALAVLALAPARAGLFVAAMFAGMALHARTARRPVT